MKEWKSGREREGTSGPVGKDHRHAAARCAAYTYDYPWMRFTLTVRVSLSLSLPLFLFHSRYTARMQRHAVAMTICRFKGPQSASARRSDRNRVL